MQKEKSSAIGRNLRLNRILKDEKAVIFAFDHGFEHGPTDFSAERIDPKVIVKLAVEAKLDAIMTTKGVAEATSDIWMGRIPLILKLTGKTAIRPSEMQLLQYQIGTVEDAVKMGADAVAATVYWGAPQEEVMAERFARFVSQCENYGMPIMILAYPRGPAIKNMHDTQVVAYATRASAELGADLIKTHYTGSTENFREVVKVSPVPILMSGGAKALKTIDFLRVTKSVMDAGAAGVVVGRNVFQSPDFVGIAEAIKSIVHMNRDPKEAAGEANIT